MEKTFVIGCGTGRCGTKSLATLLNNCKNCNVSHEFRRPEARRSYRLNWYFNQQEADLRLKLLKELEGKIVGDIALYYLNYIPFLIENLETLKILYLIRNIDDTIQSYFSFTERQKIYPWSKEDCPEFEGYSNSKFSRCFPTFKTCMNKKEAIRIYCNLYKKRMERYDNILKIPLECFNDMHQEIFSFIGIPEADRKDKFVWENSQSTTPHGENL